MHSPAPPTRLRQMVILRALTREIGEMCSFAVQVDDEVVYVASAEPPQDLTLSFRAGRKAPLFCTSSGRLFLARLDDASLARYLETADCPAFHALHGDRPQETVGDHSARAYRGLRCHCPVADISSRKAPELMPGISAMPTSPCSAGLGPSLETARFGPGA